MKSIRAMYSLNISPASSTINAIKITAIQTSKIVAKIDAYFMILYLYKVSLFNIISKFQCFVYHIWQI